MRTTQPLSLLALTFATMLGLVVPVHGANPVKTLHVAFTTPESGIDPQAVSDAYSFYLCNAIFDPLYTYDYFARPVRIVPNTADGMPQITDDGRTYTIKVRPGIYFADDPVFKGKKRELVAADYVYSIKRIFDPKVRSYWIYLFENNLAGLDDVLARARKSGSLDYDAPIEGLRALDRYTLRIRFKKPDYVFQWWLTFDGLSAVAREVVDAYKDESNRVMDHPVGTAAYRLKDWTRGQKIVLEANPDFRSETYPAPSVLAEPADAAIARQNAGKKLPIAQRVEINVIEEAQPRLLTFDRGELDYFELPAAVATNVLADGALRPDFAKRGVALHRQIEPAIDFTFFNLDNPVVGGYTTDRIALRRAISMGFDRDADIKLIANGQAIAATQLVPPPVYGYDPSMLARNGYDPMAARALLDKFGYKVKDADGYRLTPDGKPLTLIKASATTAVDRTRDELWKRSMDAIGVRITFLKQKWPELNKMSEAGQLMMWNLAWISSVPDGDSFFSVLYSKNIGTLNDARFRLPEYDRLYEESRRWPNGPEREAAYRKMNDLVQSYAPWVLGDYPYGNVLAQPWLKGYKFNPYLRNQWKYYDVERP